MTTTAQIEANRANAQRSTGPKTVEGKARSSQNALTHGLTARELAAIPRGPFVEDPDWVVDFCDRIVTDLAPKTFTETVEAEGIARLRLRRVRLVQLETLAMAGTTRAPLRPPQTPGGPPGILGEDQERAAAAALSSDLLHQIPRYEGHLSRELDRSLARYRRMQEERVQALVVSPPRDAN